MAYREDLSRMIIAPETTSLLRQNIAIIIETHGISKFISGEAAAKRCLEMFDMIMAQHRYDDAFFFLVRAKMFPSV